MATIKPRRFLKQAIQLLAYAYSGVIVGYFILRLTVWDRFWVVGFISTFIPFIFFPLFFLPILAFLVIKKRWFLIVSSIACIFLLSWLHLKYWSIQPINSSNFQGSLKILSLNTSWYKTQSEALLKLVKKEQPDIICLQEIVYKHTKRAFQWLKDSYPYQVGKPPVGILSRYPILSSEILHLAGHREVQQRAIIRINQEDVVVYNIQATSPWIRPQKILPFLTLPVYDYTERSGELQDLVQRLQKETNPVIVAGDFNMTDESQDYSWLETVLQDSFQKSGLGFGFTWPQGWELGFLIKQSDWKLNYPLFRIDYIWYSKHWGSKFTQVLPSIGSEHLPVETTLVRQSSYSDRHQG